MFVGESGDHSLDVIDRQYPMFVLAGVILETPYDDPRADVKNLERLRSFVS